MASHGTPDQVCLWEWPPYKGESQLFQGRDIGSKSRNKCLPNSLL
jgi:hypothetical protein